MSNPVIDSVSPAGPVSAKVGVPTTLHVTGHDDDSRTSVVKLALQDNEGNLSQVTPVSFQFDDGLKLVATCDDPKVSLAVNGFDVVVTG